MADSTADSLNVFMGADIRVQATLLAIALIDYGWRTALERPNPRNSMKQALDIQDFSIILADFSRQEP